MDSSFYDFDFLIFSNRKTLIRVTQPQGQA